jgi:hypothetical protein
MTKPIFENQPLHCCDFSAIQIAPTSFAEILSYYDRLRSYVVHEDGLINSRLTWSLTAHGFLFATFGLLAGKEVDLFVELHKTPTNPFPIEYTITGLFVVQFVISFFGAFIAHQAREAIVAAHNAIQHLFAIGHAEGILGLQGERKVTVAAAIATGAQTVTPSSIEHIAVGTRVLIRHPNGGAEEIVRVTALAGTSFDAVFRLTHPAGASLWALGQGLLPKIIGGGAMESHTGGAHSYYLLLPLATKGVWLVFALVSLGLAICSVWPRGWFFSCLLGIR